MNTFSKPISKTVERRQLKRLRPRHYEILARVVKGESQTQIARDMGIGEPWLSVMINSPLFQEELNKRLRLREEEMLKPLNEKKAKPIVSPNPGQRDEREKHNWLPEGFAESVIKALKQTRANEKKIFIGPTYEEQPTARPIVESSKPEPIEPQPIARAVSPQQPINVQSEAPAKRESIPTSQVQAARFWSQTLDEWIWLVFDYPGERFEYGMAQQILRLTNGTPWKIYARSFQPSDGYSCYSGDEIPLLRGKTAEELRALHQKEREN